MSELAKRIRQSRITSIDVDKFRFSIRRPTDVEAGTLHARKASTFEVARDYVCDWSKVNEKDIFPAGDDADVKFDAVVWA